MLVKTTAVAVALIGTFPLAEPVARKFVALPVVQQPGIKRLSDSWYGPRYNAEQFSTTFWKRYEFIKQRKLEFLKQRKDKMAFSTLSPYVVLETVRDLASNGSEGECPTNAMIKGNDGNLYGTTGWCNANVGSGVFYKVVTTGPAYDPTSTYTVLHDFDDGSVTDDGHICVGKLAKDNSGNIYGSCREGGTYNYGIVYRINVSTGVYTILHHFGSVSNDGRWPNSGIVRDSVSGNLYGTTNNGGGSSNCISGGCGAVFKLTPSGSSFTYSKIHNFTGGTSGGDAPHSQLIASNGHLYGLTIGGGANYTGIMFRVSLSTNTFSKLLDIPAGEYMWLQGMTQIPTAHTSGNRLEFWGLTDLGGTYGAGSLYKIAETSPGSGSFTYTVMHSMDCSSSEGCLPAGDVVFSTTFPYSGGKALYGNLWDAGVSGFGSFFQYDYVTQTYWDIHSTSGAWAGPYNDEGPWGLLESTVSGTPVLFGGSEFGGANNKGWLWFLRGF